MEPSVPPTEEQDREAVTLALDVARSQAARDDWGEAIRWVRKAADAAFDAGDDRRGAVLAKAAADLGTSVQVQPIAPSQPPPPLTYHTSAPPPPVALSPVPPFPRHSEHSEEVETIAAEDVHLEPEDVSVSELNGRDGGSVETLPVFIYPELGSEAGAGDRPTLVAAVTVIPRGDEQPATLAEPAAALSDTLDALREDLLNAGRAPESVERGFVPVAPSTTEALSFSYRATAPTLVPEGDEPPSGSTTATAIHDRQTITAASAETGDSAAKSAPNRAVVEVRGPRPSMSSPELAAVRVAVSRGERGELHVRPIIGGLPGANEWEMMLVGVVDRQALFGA